MTTTTRARRVCRLQRLAVLVAARGFLHQNGSGRPHRPQHPHHRMSRSRSKSSRACWVRCPAAPPASLPAPLLAARRRRAAATQRTVPTATDERRAAESCLAAHLEDRFRAVMMDSASDDSCSSMKHALAAAEGRVEVLEGELEAAAAEIENLRRALSSLLVGGGMVQPPGPCSV